MKTIGLYLTVTAFLLVLGTDGEAQAGLQVIHCPGSSNQLHEDNLKHALLAEIARGYVDPSEDCNIMNGHDSNGWVVQDIDKKLVYRTMKEWNENEERTMEFDNDSTPYTLKCYNGNGPIHRFQVSYKFAVSNNNLNFLVRVFSVGLATSSDTEEFQVVEVSTQDGPVLSFRGTNLEDGTIRQVRTSLNNLIENSCLFEFSAKLAGNFYYIERLAEYLPEEIQWNLGIVGHSLGGAVVQHIVTDPEFNNTLMDLRRGHDDFVFDAYSFNSIGVQRSRGNANEELGNMTSVTVAGEILELLANNLEESDSRRQIGNIFRYNTIPGHREEMISPDDIMIDDPNYIRAIRLHRISTVKESICRCLSGQGNYGSYERPNR